MDQLQLNRAGDLLLKYGPKSITMNDVAAHLGVSKKTLYLEFANKLEIIERVISQNVAQFRADAEAVAAEASNAIQQVLQMNERIVNITGLVKAGFAAEMHKSYSSTWQQIEENWHSLLLQLITNNLNRGISEGLFRPELDMEFTAALRLQQLQAVISGEQLLTKQLGTRSYSEKLTDFYLQAITTEKGRLLLQ